MRRVARSFTAACLCLLATIAAHSAPASDSVFKDLPRDPLVVLGVSLEGSSARLSGLASIFDRLDQASADATQLGAVPDTSVVTELYDALMDEYEPEMTAERTAEIFAPLREFTVGLLAEPCRVLSSAAARHEVDLALPAQIERALQRADELPHVRRERGDARLPGQQALPYGFDSAAQRADRAHAGDDDTFAHEGPSPSVPLE